MKRPEEFYPLCCLASANRLCNWSIEQQVDIISSYYNLDRILFSQVEGQPESEASWERAETDDSLLKQMLYKSGSGEAGFQPSVLPTIFSLLK